MKIRVGNSLASRLVNCGMVVLISCGYKGRKNITTCAWHMPVSKQPPFVAVALAKGHFSSELIKRSKEFVVNVPLWRHLDKVILCGKLKGREADKFEKTGFNARQPHILKEAVIVEECVASLECKLASTFEEGDHFVFTGEVVCAEAEEEFFSDIWDTAKVEFIFHLGGRFFFKSRPADEVNL